MPPRVQDPTVVPPRAAPAERFVAHAAGVWRYLRMHGAAPHEADDLVQEAFLVALQKDVLRLDPAAAFTFLRRTARFLFLRRRQAGLDATLLADAVDALYERDCAADGGDALVERLRHCLSRLSPRARRAVERSYGLHELERASREQLAAELGLQPSGVKTLMQRARQQLRACIEQDPGDLGP